MQKTPSPPDPPTLRTTSVFVHALTGRMVSACQDGEWWEHLAAWRQAGRHGNTAAAAPMPWGPLLCERPLSDGSVPRGTTSQALHQAAITVSVRSSLDGWDRGVDPERREKIVAAPVHNCTAPWTGSTLVPPHSWHVSQPPQTSRRGRRDASRRSRTAVACTAGACLPHCEPVRALGMGAWGVNSTDALLQEGKTPWQQRCRKGCIPETRHCLAPGSTASLHASRTPTDTMPPGLCTTSVTSLNQTQSDVSCTAWPGKWAARPRQAPDTFSTAQEHSMDAHADTEDLQHDCALMPADHDEEQRASTCAAA